MCLWGVIEHWHQHQLACCSFTPLTSLWVFWFTAQTLPGLQGDHAVWMCLREKPPQGNVGAIKRFKNLTTCIVHADMQPAHDKLPNWYNSYVLFLLCFPLYRRLCVQSFHLLSSLQFFCITLIKQDVCTKTGKGFSLYCTLLHPFSVQIALHPLFFFSRCTVPVLDAVTTSNQCFFFLF